MSKLTHINTAGEANMVNVGGKPQTLRMARAGGRIHMQAQTLALVRNNAVKKGDVLSTARLAGIMAAKRTADLVPLCHPLPLTSVEVSLELNEAEHSIDCEARAETVGRTGVEMEALTAVQVALLTVYDMCKAVDRGMRITDVCLLEKLGGKSGHWNRESP